VTGDTIDDRQAGTMHAAIVRARPSLARWRHIIERLALPDGDDVVPAQEFVRFREFKTAWLGWLVRAGAGRIDSILDGEIVRAK
jgi:hypothetical protein